MDHIIVLYIISLVRFIVIAHIKFKRLPEDALESERLSILDKAQRSLLGSFALHIVFLTPTFLIGIFNAIIFYVLDLILIADIL